MTDADNASANYPLGPALDFLQRLWRLNHSLERLSRRMEKELGITAQQRLVVRCLGKYPGMTAGALAAVLHLDPGTVSATVKRLEGRGLLKRRRDPGDKRRISLGLAAEGRALGRPSRATVEDAAEKLLSSMNSRELRAVTAVLDRFTALLDERSSGTGTASGPKRSAQTTSNPATRTERKRRSNVSEDRQDDGVATRPKGLVRG